MSNFINNTNKNQLLQILINNNNLKDNQTINEDYIKTILITSMNEIVNKYTINTSNNLTYEQVLQLNKQVLLLSKNKFSLYDFKENQNNENNITSNTIQNQVINKQNNDKDNYLIQNTTRSDISNIKQKHFEDKLLQKQKEFESFKPVPPKKISFNDEINDKQIGGQMDVLIAQAIEMREKEMNKIFNNSMQPIMQPIMQTTMQTTMLKNNYIDSNIKHLKIGEELSFDDNNIIDLNTNKNEPQVNKLFTLFKIKNNDTELYDNNNNNINKLNNIPNTNINNNEFIINNLENLSNKLVLLDNKIDKLDNIINNNKFNNNYDILNSIRLIIREEIETLVNKFNISNISENTNNENTNNENTNNENTNNENTNNENTNNENTNNENTNNE
jgi:hypothetical protein